MEDNITIKRLTSTDAKILQSICIDTFVETFAMYNTDKNMQQFLSESFNDKKIIAELNDPNCLLFGIFCKDEIAGYLKINTKKGEPQIQQKNVVEVERIYVLKKYQGKKIGQQLLNTAIQNAIQINAEFVWLGVWENNITAINFYKKNGFKIFGDHIFMVGDDPQKDLLMKKSMC